MLTVERVQKALEDQSLGRFFTKPSLEALLRFVERMLQLNQTHNLTKWIKDEEVLTFHLLDSAVALPLLEELTQNKPQKWVDLGSGCGFPGAILIAAFPEMKVTLLDSVKKKVDALRECVLAAGWSAETLCARAEKAGKGPEIYEKWDGVVARAVADLPTLLEYCQPLLKPGGYLVSWMTEKQMETVDNSKEALKAYPYKTIKIQRYSFPFMEQNRVLLVVEKLGKTP